jgi:uncharacterized protein
MVAGAPLWSILFAMQWHCPIWRKPTDSGTSADFPFCSERCKLLDLGNWSGEKYRVSEPVIDEPAPGPAGEDAYERKD